MFLFRNPSVWLAFLVMLSMSVPQFRGPKVFQPGKAPVTQSRFRPQFTMIRPDSSQMVKSGCIGMRGDGKKENQASIRCLMMLLRCLHDSSTDPLRLMTTELPITTVALRMLTMPTIRYGASKIQASRATVPSHPPTNVHDSVVVMRQSWGGGGGTLFFLHT